MPDELFFGSGQMENTIAIESLGTRIVSVARLAVAVHLSMNTNSNFSPEQLLGEIAMVGGADRCVTDDAQSFVAGRD